MGWLNPLSWGRRKETEPMPDQPDNRPPWLKAANAQAESEVKAEAELDHLEVVEPEPADFTTPESMTAAEITAAAESLGLAPSPSYIEEPGANLDDPSDTGTFGLTAAQIAQNAANIKAAAPGDVVDVNKTPAADQCAAMHEHARQAEAAVIAMRARLLADAENIAGQRDAALAQRDEARRYAEELHVSGVPADCGCDDACEAATAAFQRIIEIANS